MCSMIILPDGSLVETAGQAKAVLGDKAVFFSEAGNDECLCGLDVEATARNCGYAVEDDCGDFQFVISNA